MQEPRLQPIRSEKKLSFLFIGQAYSTGVHGQAADTDKAYLYLYKGQMLRDAACSHFLAALCEGADQKFLDKMGIRKDDVKNFYQAAADRGYVSARNKVRDIHFRSELEPVYGEGELLHQSICLTSHAGSSEAPFAEAFLSETDAFD